MKRGDLRRHEVGESVARGRPLLDARDMELLAESAKAPNRACVATGPENGAIDGAIVATS